MTPQPERIEFGRFTMDLRERQLSCGSAPVSLTAKAFDVLAVLVRSAGSLVTKADLMDQVWPGAFVEESNLTQNISMVRRALAIDPDSADYIETVPRIGYRFRATIRVPAPEAAAETPVPVNIPRRVPVNRIAAAFAVGILAIGGGFWYLRAHRPPATVPLVAVLPLSNPAGSAAGNPELVWYGRALGELLAAELSADGHVATVPGEETARMRSDLGLPEVVGLSGETLQRIRKHSGGDYAITGSYLPTEGGILLNLRLQDTRTGATAGAFRFTGTEAELGKTASEAGKAIRSRLGAGALAVPDRARVAEVLPPGPAQTAYVNGLERLRAQDAVAARPLLEQVVTAAPKFAPGHARLSEVWLLLGFDGKAQAEAKAAWDLMMGGTREDVLEAEARYRIAMGEWPRAIEVYRSLRTFYPTRPDYGIALARTQISGGKPNEAGLVVAELRRNLPAGYQNEVMLVSGDAAVARGELDLARREFTSCIAAARLDGARHLEGLASSRLADTLYQLGKAPESETASAEAQRHCAEVGDTGCVAEALNSAARQAIVRGDRARARPLLARALMIERTNGDRRRMAESVEAMGRLESSDGNKKAARQHYTEALEIAREIGSDRRAALLLGRLASLDQGAGQAALARERFRESSAATSASEGPRERVIRLDNEARIMARDGDLAGARKAYEAALSEKRQSATPVSMELTLRLLATVAEHQGDLKRAREAYQEACQLAEGALDARGLWLCRLRLAEMDLLAGDAAAALKAIPAIGKPTNTSYAVLERRLSALANLAVGNKAEAATAVEEGLAMCAAEKRPAAVDCIRLQLADSRVKLALGRPAQARQRAEDALKAANQNRIMAYTLEARVVLAELSARDAAPGARQQAAALQREAVRMGFHPIADAAARLTR